MYPEKYTHKRLKIEIKEFDVNVTRNQENKINLPHLKSNYKSIFDVKNLLIERFPMRL